MYSNQVCTFLVKHESLLPSQKDDCHPISAKFGDDPFFNRNIDTRERIIMDPFDSFLIETQKLCHS